jgi:hypothetical protein
VDNAPTQDDTDRVQASLFSKPTDVQKQREEARDLIQRARFSNQRLG